ncbi:MAG: LamG domain-containing protein [Desulfosarcina sp.]|nr:LamG domain-containing protein [Desulfosarcina sp.]
MIISSLAFQPAISTYAACPDDIFAYWKLDEPTPGAPNGTYADIIKDNAGTGNVNPTAATGIINGAQAFNSTDKTQINVPADNSFDWQSNESFSIEFWMKTDGVAPAEIQVIIGRDDIPATGLHWWVGINKTDGKVSFFLRETNGIGGSLLGVGTISLADGSWHHVVAVRDNSTKDNIIYVDGFEQGRVNHTYGAGFGSATADLNIGWLNLGTGFYFDGLIDEVALYDRALSLAEIQAHRYAGLAGDDYCSGVAPFVPFPDDTISLWQLDEPTPDAPNGTYADSFDGNNGTGNVNPIAAIGIVNGAQTFNSANNTQINVPADNSFDWQSNESFSIEFWVKTDGFAPVEDQAIIGRDDVPATGLHWWIGVHNTDGRVSFFLKETNGIGATLSGVGTISLADGSWHHVVAVRDDSASPDGDNIIYVDGFEQGRVSHNYVTRFGSATADLNIGWLDTGTSFYFDGLIDEVALYDRALPLAEIQEHHYAGLQGNGIVTLRPGPVADAGADDADGAIVSYLWEPTAGTSVTLTNASTDTATFTAPNVAAAGAILTIQLTVTDDDGQKSIDTISVNVNDGTVTSTGGGGGGGGCFITMMF